MTQITSDKLAPGSGPTIAGAPAPEGALGGRRELDILDQYEPGDRSEGFALVLLGTTAFNHKTVSRRKPNGLMLKGDLQLAVEYIPHVAFGAPILLDESIRKLHQADPLATAFYAFVASTRSHGLPFDALEVNASTSHWHLPM
jgi:hypothetical protein